MADFSYLARPSAEWTSFLQQQSLPPTPDPTSNPDIKAIRRRINLQRFTVSRDELKAMGGHGVKAKTLMIVGEDCVEIPIRLYSPRNRGTSVLLYFHGGGFFSGSLSTEDATCTSLAQNCGVTVVSVGYRLAPEWEAPAPFQDAWDARCWVMQNAASFGIPRRFGLYVMGISAGACLAASIVVRERMLGQSVIQGQCLAAPWLCLPDKFPYEQIRDSKASPMQCQNAALLSYAWVVQYARMMDTPESCRDSPIINPLLFDEKAIDKLPPTHIMVCGDDPLRDHGMLFKDKLEHLGVPVKLNVYPGYAHYFRRFPDAPANDVWDDDLREGISWMISHSGPVFSLASHMRSSRGHEDEPKDAHRLIWKIGSNF